MELSFRLKKLTEKITPSNNLIDIGTDHAYIPIFLYKNNIITSALACDISKGSLEKAKINIRNNNLQNVIQTRLSNGFEKITKDDNPQSILIAGMGGMLIINILEDGKLIVNESKELILQPQKDIPKVRQYLHKNGFKIVDDEIIIDDFKYYTIIKAIKGIENPYTEAEYMFGKIQIDNKSQILKQYIEYNINKISNIILSLQNTNATSRLNNLKNELDLHKEVLKCL